VLDRAELLFQKGLSAGDIYHEVWVRDLNSFIEFALALGHQQAARDSLLTFLDFQGEDGNIVDGFVPSELAAHDYKYLVSETRPDLRGFKNTAETDHESSLIQAIYKYVYATGDNSILRANVAGQIVLARLHRAVAYLYTHRFDNNYGLIWGGTTADWGDVQPEHSWGVTLDKDSHPAIDIYDNAMLLVALQNLHWLQAQVPEASGNIVEVDVEKAMSALRANILQHLWDKTRAKFRPHIYLEDSPFSTGFEEERVHFHGGTTVAIEAGLLEDREIGRFLEQVVHNKQRAGAASIGLTLYPAYPEGFFKNPQMAPYSYQNGGDWTWFGARLVQQLIAHGYYQEAWRELGPMLERVIQNEGYYEWYDTENSPKGSGEFKGSAGALSAGILRLRAWAETELEESHSAAE